MAPFVSPFSSYRADTSLSNYFQHCLVEAAGELRSYCNAVCPDAPTLKVCFIAYRFIWFELSFQVQACGQALIMLQNEFNWSKERARATVANKTDRQIIEEMSPSRRNPVSKQKIEELRERATNKTQIAYEGYLRAQMSAVREQMKILFHINPRANPNLIEQGATYILAKTFPRGVNENELNEFFLMVQGLNQTSYNILRRWINGSNGSILNGLKQDIVIPPATPCGAPPSASSMIAAAGTKREREN